MKLKDAFLQAVQKSVFTVVLQMIQYAICQRGIGCIGADNCEQLLR